MTQYMPLFRSCSNLRSVSQLHAHLLVTGRLRRDLLPVTKLIESYAFMGSPDSSRLVFEAFPYPDSFMYGVLIKCNVWCHLLDAAIDLYHKLVLEKTQISKFVFPSVLRACAGSKDHLSVGRKVHGRIIKSGVNEDDVIETSLLSMYGQTGNLSDAEKVFDGMHVRDLVAWSTLVSICLENGEVVEALRMFKCMVDDGVEPDAVTMISVVEGCAELGCLRIAKSVHGQITRKVFEFDETLSNSLLTMYSKCGDLFSSERIFEKIVKKNAVSWTAMISSYNRGEFFEKALRSFSEMLKFGIEPNLVTLYSVLSSCGLVGLIREGKSVHGFAVRRELDPKYESLSPALVELYAECGRLSDSETVLRAVGDRNIVSWNSLISLYAHRGMVIEALCLFREMVRRRIKPDSFTLASTISACEKTDLVQLGKQIHGHVIRTDVLDEFVQNSMIDMYSKGGFVDSACTVFDQIKHKSVVTWNSMLCGFSQNGNSLEAINLFDYMYHSFLQMNEVTFLAVIQACSNIGSLEKGKWIHHKLIVCGLNDLFTDTALIDMYAKCGDLNSAETIFRGMSSRSIVSWSSMINAYGMHGRIGSALSTFNQMVESGTKPNEVVFMNVLSACGHSGSVEEGKYYFNLIKSFGILPNSEHFACFIDLLSRYGDLEEAYRTIKEMPFLSDATIWGSLVSGCRIHRRMDIIKAMKNDLSDIVTDDTGYYTLLSNVYAEEGEWEEFRRTRSTMKSSNLRKVPGYSAIEIDKKVFRFGAGEEPCFQTGEIYRFLGNFKNLTLEADYLQINE
ncbi:putative pentatricopeptide repeat-containing protein [Cardamine amara subsp. amara]|uniref:Pentatricopeptide repeat-containing protein n=1 Tax=Cardamine amara subsp. amara TaxID=228776 RepID=A0ABD1BMW0_CARAN